MGKLSFWLIALGSLIFALGSFYYMGFIDFIPKRDLSDPVALLCIGICLISFGKFDFAKKKR